MTMIAHYQRLLEYDDWANREVLNAVRQSGGHAQSLKLLAHILSAEKLWLERLLEKPQTYPVWPDFTIEQCESEVDELAKRWPGYLNDLGEQRLTETIRYKNTKGEDWTSIKQDILMHAVIHSAYHRGQIATQMRAAGFTPAYTDFIHAVREGLIE